MRRLRLLSIVVALGAVCLLSVGSTGRAAELVLAENGESAYQIVLPKATGEAVVDQTLRSAAEVLKEMFAANGIDLPVVEEPQADGNRPGIYLGDTAAARGAWVEASRLPVWTYAWKTDGGNVIIAGRDWKAPGQQGEAASLGTVKGLADFMREYCGTRFLAPGGLAGIEFLPTPRIAVPAGLDVLQKPALGYNAGRPTTDIAKIALNFLNNVTSEFGGHTHERAVPAEKYADTNPEYFALINGERIRERPHPWLPDVLVKEPHLCYSNKGVQELIYQDMLRSFDLGYPNYQSMQADGFKPCRCEDCQKMFGTDNWGEKLWQLNKMWADRLLKDRPGKTLTVGAYTVTERPPQSFTEFPPNLLVKLRSTQDAFDQWASHKVPAGFTTYLHAWGGYHLCGYLPVRTPLYTEKIVKMFRNENVQGVGLDSPPANLWMLEGPAVYVYGRMFDDPANNSALKLVNEYVDAMYGEAAGPMRRFYEELHHTLEIYAEVFGVDDGTFQTYRRADGRRVRYLTTQTKLRLIGFLYPPETLDLLEGFLAQAERTAGLSEKRRMRLALARREFDYLKSTARVVHMYNAYLTRTNRTTLDELLAEMEARKEMIMSWYMPLRHYRGDNYYQHPLFPEWPLYIGGAGHYNTHLLANGGSYLSRPVPPFTWDISKMREAALFDAKRIAAARLAAAPALGGAAWDALPAHKLGALSLGAGEPEWATEVKVAYDANALYIRFEGALPVGSAAPAEMERDDTRILSSESFWALLAPDNNPARFYRLAAGMAETAQYDARKGFVEDSINPLFKEDDTDWNPEWRLECAVGDDAKGWSALMVVPFRSLGVSAPVKGNEWKANFARARPTGRGPSTTLSAWSTNPGAETVDDPETFGVLVFD